MTKEEHDAKKVSDKDERKDRHSAGPAGSSVKGKAKKDGHQLGKSGDEDAALDKGDPNYDSEGEEGEAAEEAPAAAEPSKPIEYEGAAAGKYQWDDSRPKGDADSALGQAITKYGWSDGKKQVSVYIELDGLDELAEKDFDAQNGNTTVSLTISNLGGKTRKFALSGLSNEIDGVTVQQKKGKSPNMVVLKLKKKEEGTWYKLLESEGKSGGGDDDDGGGMGGMGGMGGGGMGGMGGKGGGKGAQPDDDAEKEGGGGKWNWSQKDEAVHVRIAIEPPASSKKDVNVVFKATKLLVSIRGETVIDGALGGKVETDECTWCFSPAKDELQVMLTKVEGKTEKWNNLLG